MSVNIRKVGIIGCGFVGSATAFALMQSEIVMLDADRAKAEGEALDISHGMPFGKPAAIYAGDYDDIADAAVVIVTAGAAQKSGETRLDLIRKNVDIFKSIIPSIAERNFRGILLIVANPVDVLTYVAKQLSGLSDDRVFGSGTVLDSARLRYNLSTHLGVDPRSVHAFIIGEHGDSEFAAWSNANVSGIEISRFCEMRGYYHDHDLAKDQIADEVRNAAYDIISKKRATYYGIAMSAKRICEAIVRDEKSILPVSSIQHGRYGITDVALSVPVIVGKDGIESEVPFVLNDDEIEKLCASAATLKEVIRSLDL